MAAGVVGSASSLGAPVAPATPCRARFGEPGGQAGPPEAAAATWRLCRAAPFEEFSWEMCFFTERDMQYDHRKLLTMRSLPEHSPNLTSGRC